MNEAATHRAAQRVENLPPHELADLLGAVRAKQAAGQSVLSLAMGDPDLPPPPAATEALLAALNEPDASRYSPFAGTPSLRQAFAARIKRRYAVALDPETEVLPVIGSKEGLAHLALAVLNPGDRALVPDPGYGMYRSATVLAGGEICAYPLDPEADWQPDRAALEAQADGARLLWLNYPNNPTGGSGTAGMFEWVLDLAWRHDLLVVHDLAYGEVFYDPADRPLSILQIERARDRAVEFHSLSKSYNMCGWRVGALVGSAEVVAATRRLKLGVDNGIFLPIQAAAAAALALDDDWIEQRNQIYARRRDLAVAAWQSLGLPAASPKAGLYVWAGIPSATSSHQFALDLLERAGVAIVPGTAYGPSGEGYVRLSLTVPDAGLEEAMDRITASIAAK
jgi:LL-diaminopimelate aminotransferase